MNMNQLMTRILDMKYIFGKEAQDGDDTIDNLISLCYSCHMKEHALNRSELTKAGLERRKNAPIKDILISKIDLLEKIQNGELTDPLDIVDCIIDAPCKKCITENYQYEYGTTNHKSKQ